MTRTLTSHTTRLHLCWVTIWCMTTVYLTHSHTHNILCNSPLQAWLPQDTHCSKLYTYNLKNKFYMYTYSEIECIFENAKQSLLPTCWSDIKLMRGGHYVCYFLDHGQNQWFPANDLMLRSNANYSCDNLSCVYRYHP